MVSLFVVNRVDVVLGTLDADEIRQLAQELKESNTAGDDDSTTLLGDTELAAAIDEMDGDGNGSVDFEEFWIWWQDRLAGKQSKSSVFTKAFQSPTLTGKTNWIDAESALTSSTSAGSAFGLSPAIPWTICKFVFLITHTIKPFQVKPLLLLLPPSADWRHGWRHGGSLAPSVAVSAF
eukprot:COSAG02_NODE_5683_length_4131_cov_2.397817_1_plen_178_part_00